MKPVLARLIDSFQVAFEVDRSEQGFVTLFLPGSPDPWAGRLVIVEVDRIQTLDLTFAETVSIFEKMGRDSMALYESHLSRAASE